MRAELTLQERGEPVRAAALPGGRLREFRDRAERSDGMFIVKSLIGKTQSACAS